MERGEGAEAGAYEDEERAWCTRAGAMVLRRSSLRTSDGGREERDGGRVRAQVRVRARQGNHAGGARAQLGGRLCWGLGEGLRGARGHGEGLRGGLSGEWRGRRSGELVSGVCA